MIKVLVHAQRGITEAGPGTSDRMIGSRAAHALQCFSLVQLREPFATTLIETKGTPLVTGSIVTGEKNEGILQISTLFQKRENPSDTLIHMINHSGKSGHPID